MQGSKRLAEEAIKEELELAMKASLTRAEMEMANRASFSTGNGATQTRSFVVDHERVRDKL